MKLLLLWVIVNLVIIICGTAIYLIGSFLMWEWVSIPVDSINWEDFRIYLVGTLIIAVLLSALGTDDDNYYGI